MRNARPLIIIVTSLVIGVIAVMLAQKWVENKADLATNPVVVAKSDLPIGTRVTPDAVQVVEWPANSPLSEPFSDVAKVHNRVVMATVLRGEPILATKLAPAGESGGISATLGEGRRAITVKVNEIAGVAGFALPGNYVDVLVNTTDESNKPVSKIVLERILVLAVAQQAESKDNKPKVVEAVTLEVTPQEAENLDLARNIGALALVLRNQLEPRGVVTAGARKADLLRLASRTVNGRSDSPRTEEVSKPVAAPAPVAKRAPAARAPVQVAVEQKVEVIRGAKKSLE